MERCSICNGRVLQSESGTRCMNPKCEGSKETAKAKDSVTCRCGEDMHYRGLNSWGEPEYVCISCGAQAKL